MNTQANAMHNFVELMSLAQPTAQEPDASLRPWSELTESMTAAVAHHCRGHASVRLLEEGIGSISSWEQDELCAPGDVYIRHIELSVAEVPRLIARSIVAADSPVVALMQGLGERPLAELLFTDPLWQRATRTTHLQAPTDLPGRAVLWCHQAHQHQLLVEEFFLPALLQRQRPN